MGGGRCDAHTSSRDLAPVGVTKLDYVVTEVKFNGINEGPGVIVVEGLVFFLVKEL